MVLENFGEWLQTRGTWKLQIRKLCNDSSISAKTHASKPKHKYQRECKKTMTMTTTTAATMTTNTTKTTTTPMTTTRTMKAKTTTTTTMPLPMPTTMRMPRAGLFGTQVCMSARVSSLWRNWCVSVIPGTRIKWLSTAGPKIGDATLSEGDRSPKKGKKPQPRPLNTHLSIGRDDDLLRDVEGGACGDHRLLTFRVLESANPSHAHMCCSLLTTMLQDG